MYKTEKILAEDLSKHEYWKDDFYFTVFRHGTDEIIDIACVYTEKEDGVWGIGYSIHHELSGQGLGTELIAGLHQFVKAKGTQVLSAKVVQKTWVPSRIV